MGFRFRRSIRLLPGVRLNLGKRGVSVSAGVRGAHVTVSEHGTRTTVGVPGTGLSYTDYQRHGAPSARPYDGADGAPVEGSRASGISPLLALVVIMSLVGLIVWAAS